MEATSDYWRGVFYLLEAHGLETWLVNARDVKHLPGRPRPTRWTRCGCARSPSGRCCGQASSPTTDPAAAGRGPATGPIWWRHRPRRSSGSSRLLEDAQIKLSSVASDIFGVSGRARLAALVAGGR